jgi:hypothetical protein
MIAISTIEFRKNLRKYLNMANKERVIVQCGKSEAYEIVPAQPLSDTDAQLFSDSALLEVLKKGEMDFAAGRFTEIKDPKNIGDSLR